MSSSSHLNDFKFISETTAACTPPPSNLNSLIACIIEPLRTLGITSSRPTQAHHMHNTVHGCHSELTHYQLWFTIN